VIRAGDVEQQKADIIERQRDHEDRHECAARADVHAVRQGEGQRELRQCPDDRDQPEAAKRARGEQRALGGREDDDFAPFRKDISQSPRQKRRGEAVGEGRDEVIVVHQPVFGHVVIQREVPVVTRRVQLVGQPVERGHEQHTCQHHHRVFQPAHPSLSSRVCASHDACSSHRL